MRILCLLAAMIPFLLTAEQLPDQPFSDGERLTYDLSYGIVPAGTATFLVRAENLPDGTPVFRFILRAQTNAVIDRVFKVRDTIVSITDRQVDHAIRYIKRQHEGGKQGEEQVDFDWVANQATRTRDNEVEKPIAVTPGMLDPLSILYRCRLQADAVGDTLSLPITDGKRTYTGEIKLLRRETIKVSGQSYDTFYIEPDMQRANGVSARYKRAKVGIWITADDRHLPVKVTVALPVGSFTGELSGIVTKE